MAATEAAMPMAMLVASTKDPCRQLRLLLKNEGEPGADGGWSDERRSSHGHHRGSHR